MTSGYEPVLHALSLAPRVARPAETVRVVFRTRNLGTLPSPPGAVRFVLPDGLEALGATEIAVEPAAPGAEVVAELHARVTAPITDRTELAVQAVLQLPDALLGTNECVLVVRGRAIVDGAASGVFVEAIDAETIRVRAVVTNEGDGAARELRIVVPAPRGCLRTDGDVAAMLDIERLDPGEAAMLAFEARIVAPQAEIRAEDGEVRFAGGRRCALPARGGVVTQPLLLAPRAVVVASRRRVDVTVDVQNDGWADARDVRVSVVLPAPLRLAEGSVFVQGVPVAARGVRRTREKSAFARLERSGAAHAVVIASVAARSTVRLTLAASVPGGCGAGSIAIGMDSHQIDVPFAPKSVRDVRLRLTGTPRTVLPGDVARIAAEVLNAGDVAETLRFDVEGALVTLAAGVAPCPVPAGACAIVELGVRVCAEAADDATVSFAVVVADCDGERTRAGGNLLVRDRAWLEIDEAPARDGDRILHTIRNVGATAARDVVAVFGAAAFHLDTIAPHDDSLLAVDERLARLGGIVRCGEREPVAIAPVDDRVPAVVHAALHAPADVLAGASFAVCAQLEVEDAVETLALRVPPIAGAAYVPGSTALDDRALLDRAGRSPLDDRGLVLRAIPAGTRVTIAWSLLADAVLDDDELMIAAELDVDGVVQPLAPLTIRAAARDAFAERPAGLTYHVEACTVRSPRAGTAPIADADVTTPIFDRDGEPQRLGIEQPCPVASEQSQSVASALRQAVAVETDAVVVDRVPPLPCDDAFAFALRLDASRCEVIARLLDGARAGGLIAHVLALRAFFPDRETSGDVAVAAALDAVDDRLRDVFDRLFVKLRIPGFAVTTDDLEDPALRTALVNLFARLSNAVPAMAESGAATARLERARIADFSVALARAPYGAPAALRALAALVPTRCDDDPVLGATLARYVSALDEVLARYDGVPLELFEDALAQSADRALDDGRAALLAALQGRTAPAEVAC